MTGRRIDQPLLGKSQRGAPKTSHALNVGIAVFIKNLHTLTPNDDQRPFLLKLTKLGVRMQVVFDVALPGYRDIFARNTHEIPFLHGSTGPIHDAADVSKNYREIPQVRTTCNSTREAINAPAICNFVGTLIVCHFRMVNGCFAERRDCRFS